MTRTNAFPEQVRELVEVAALYWQDGAPGTAAMRLRWAADALQKIADDRQAALDALVSHGDPDRT